MTGLLEDKVAIITGASRGIGAATGHAFAVDGATVVLAARNTSELDAVAGEIAGSGDEALAVPTDVTNQTMCRPWSIGRSRSTAASMPHTTVNVTNKTRPFAGILAGV